MSSKLTVALVVILLAVGSLLLFKDNSQSGGEKQAPSRYTVTDSAGRKVEIPRQPQRVVALNASSLELFYAVGGSVVGRATTEALPPAVKEALKQVPAVGITSNPNIEQIIALKPDLILGVNLSFHHNLIPVLDQAGIPILLQSLDTYDHIIDTLRFYGELAGQTEQAATVINKIQSRYEAIIAKNKNRTAPKVVVIWGSPESFHMATSRSFPGDLVKRLGAVNLADQGDDGKSLMGYLPLSMEYIAKQNPDMILLITHSPDDKASEKFRNELANHPAWRGLKAVEGNQVHRLPYNLFAVNPGTQVDEALTVLDRLLYPEVAKQ